LKRSLIENVRHHSSWSKRRAPSVTTYTDLHQSHEGRSCARREEGRRCRRRGSTGAGIAAL